MTRNKFNARATYVDGIRFASVLEATRFGQLKLMEKAGLIKKLELQPKFMIGVVEKEWSPWGRKWKLTYTADFRYKEKDTGNKTWADVWGDVVEEVKGMWTPYAKFKVAVWLLLQPRWRTRYRVLTKEDIG